MKKLRTILLARLDAEVISKKPQWMTLSCGVNDVWHFKFEGVGIEDGPYSESICRTLK
jgi:hypothetical protein